MHIRAWHSSVRDLRADWRLWSWAERLTAGFVIGGGACLMILLHPW
jgi:hypothetical protein